MTQKMQQINVRLAQGLALAVIVFAFLMLSGNLSPAIAQEGSGTGEVQRLDTANNKITLKHGAIAELDLPAMTLVYLIEAEQMAGLAPGDSVRFTARREGSGEYVIIQIKKR